MFSMECNPVLITNLAVNSSSYDKIQRLLKGKLFTCQSTTS